MYPGIATFRFTPSPGRHRQAAWRWRYRDPSTGELVSHSELLTTDEVSAIDPRAELIPGSRVIRSVDQGTAEQVLQGLSAPSMI